ncbi:tyrosine-type recombinase/integrase [Alloacidobacterium dinghuense]|uniref:Tyrosine-type recombinase/integrase n=1 Tax=Alloacidobacterium dinghuense TaxID=2763107 RepID=A0A7G8BJX1_9BACT|nr:tyrosine-type recombinase/integrase [Alloacidobacterium dinghuense]QNI32841.1 tyrosine-type recombinase/integrase [Alloacidobacterium dinghuense]
MVVHIQGGKGRKNRDFMLSPKLLDALRVYWRSRRPRVYLFPSSSGHRGVDQPISDKTIWNICWTAARRAGLGDRHIQPHTP